MPCMAEIGACYYSLNGQNKHTDHTQITTAGTANAIGQRSDKMPKAPVVLGCDVHMELLPPHAGVAAGDA